MRVEERHMSSRAWIASAAASALLVTGATWCQAPGEAPKPGPEHKKLEHFVGKWTGTGEMKPGPFGPGGKSTWTETCEWFDGGFSVVCKSEGASPMGPMKGLGVLGYNSEEKVYTYFGVDNAGWSDYAKGKVEGKTWSYSSEFKVGGKPFMSHMAIEETSATSQSFKWETSADGGKTWTVMMDGSSKK
jgi:uncharacterized protein DUF1579